MHDDCLAMLMKYQYIHVLVLHELSMWLLTEIFHRQHIHAINFVLIKQQEFSVVYNVFDVVVVEL